MTDSFSYPDYADYRDQNTVFEGLVGEDMAQAAINSENQSDVIWGQVVTGNFFDVLRVKPVLGRTFAPNEDKTAGEQAVVVIGHSLWQRRFGSDPNIVGRTINLNNRPYNVIGVAPEEFKGSKFGLSLDFWAPMMMVEELQRSPGILRSRDDQWMTMFARLKPGVSREQAAADMSAIAQRLNQSYPNERASSTKVIVRPEVEGRFDDAAAMMKSAGAIAMAIVGFVLMIACANVANLLLARAAVRRKEIGIRVALGASRARLIRQLLTESLLLAVLGGGFGLLLAYWITGLLQGFMPILPYNLVTDFFAIDRTALVFSLVVSLATGFIFGLAPALSASKPEIVPVLKGDTNASSSGRARRFTLRNTLVVTQVALSLVVLVCGGLFIKSFRNAQNIDPGFTGTGVLMVSINPQLIGYDKDQTRNAYRQILERVSGIPGVQAASFARLVQLGDSSNSNGPVLKEGETLAPGSAGRVIKTNWVSPGHFKTLQIPMLAGRDFDDRDRTGGPRAIIVNERMAQMLWPGESAVGKRITLGTENREPIEVVGVVKTGKYRNLGEEPQPFFFFPMTQRAPSGMTMMVRTDGDPRSLIGPIRKEIEAIDRRLPLAAIKTMDEHMTYALWGPNMAAMLSLPSAWWRCYWRRWVSIA